MSARQPMCPVQDPLPASCAVAILVDWPGNGDRYPGSEVGLVALASVLWSPGAMWSVDEVLSVVRPDRGALPSPSPDGDLVAMTVELPLDAKPAQEPHSRIALTGLPLEAALGAHLRVWQTSDGAPVEPFPEWATSWGGRWSPDGRRLAAYVHNEPDAPRLAVWNRDDGSVQVLPGDAGSFFTFERPQWACDGSALVTELRPHTTVSADRAVPRQPSVTIFSTADETERRKDFAGLDSSDLALVGLDGTCRILAKDWIVRAWRVSPDGRRVAGMRMDRDSLDDADGDARYELVAIDLLDGTVEIVARDIRQLYGIGWSWSPDSSRIAYLQLGLGRPDELWLVEAGTVAKPVLLSDGGGLWPARVGYTEAGSYEVPRWIDESTLLWHRAGTGFVRCPAPSHPTADNQGTGASEVSLLTRQESSYRSESWLVDLDANTAGHEGNVLSAANLANDTCEVGAVDIQTGQRTVLATVPGQVSTTPLHTGLTGSAGAFLVKEGGATNLWTAEPKATGAVTALNPNLEWPHTVDRIEWRADDAVRRGALFTPKTPPPKSGYPLVLSVYGGSRMSGLADDPDPMNGILHTSVLTSQGFAVLYPDLPMDDDRPPLEQFAELVRPAIDQVRRELRIDSSRTSVIGNSYGSYTVLSLLVTMPGTFAAAVLTAPLINPLSSYGSLDSTGHAFVRYWESGQGRMRTPPWQDPERWVSNSPYLRLGQVTTPVLIGVGSGGLPGEQAQADQLYTGLRRLGSPAELRKYDNEEHSPGMWSVPAYRNFAERALQWLQHPPEK